MSLPALDFDVLSHLAGLEPASALAALRAQRPEATLHTQRSFEALFEPADTAGLSRIERLAAALRVARLHASASATAYFRARLHQAGAGQRLVAEAEAGPDRPAPAELDLDRSIPPRWQAVVDLAVGLAQTPPVAGAEHIARLREVGLAELEILDVMQAGAFFAWANRLMLTLGEPYVEQAGA